MNANLHTLQVTIVGGGMITHDQLLPSLYHLERLGAVGPITVCALNAAPLRALAESPTLRRAFPNSSFVAKPDLCAEGNGTNSTDRTYPDLYKEVIRAMPPRQLVVVAVPDALHNEVIRVALDANQHILCVKPLVQRYAEAAELEKIACERGLLVGVEYHKRFDRRALVARQDYRAGRFGEFKIGEARLVEPWYYRHSNFQNWFTKENADPFTYVGCHYVDQLYFITGLRPVNVSVVGIEGKFPNGNVGYMWSSGRVVFENGGILNLINGLGYPDDAAGSNDQGLTMFCENGDKGGILVHNDSWRGVMHSYVRDPGPGGSLFNSVSPDYMKLVPWEGEGLKPVGYGYDSVEAIVQTARRIEAATAGLPEAEALKRRREMLRAVDDNGILATPANSYINELVTEAARYSILRNGVPVDIRYEPQPHIVPS
ncbi:MAG: Gfo/Idh/MocA family oxidoreductase [Candidatus Sumerlaeia bacterium]|nr:Gfo/Idh/MocA family oxidoreductase [Candidatus Sumerlaeia bacterium]